MNSSHTRGNAAIYSYCFQSNLDLYFLNFPNGSVNGEHLYYFLQPSESPDDSGGFVSLENASIVRLYGSSIQVFWDIQESLNLR